MMKLLSLAALTLGLLVSTGTNKAQAQALGVNCSVLSGTPMMCIKNVSNFPVVAVQATNSNMFSPTGWINIPGGMIPPGGTTIVRFNSWAGGCNQFVTIRTSTGATHTYPFVDVCHATGFIVSGW